MGAVWAMVLVAVNVNGFCPPLWNGRREGSPDSTKSLEEGLQCLNQVFVARQLKTELMQRGMNFEQTSIDVKFLQKKQKT